MYAKNTWYECTANNGNFNSGSMVMTISSGVFRKLKTGDTDTFHVFKNQARREGERGSFPGPRDVWGAPPSLKNTENGVPGGFFLT